MESLKLPTLYTLQHRLARHTESPHRIDYGNIAFRSLRDKPGSKLPGESDPPRGSRGELLSDDDPIVETAMQGGGRDPESRRGISHRQ
jgi:hypothetical protein